jgi:hypothetical protein
VVLLPVDLTGVKGLSVSAPLHSALAVFIILSALPSPGLAQEPDTSLDSLETSLFRLENIVAFSPEFRPGSVLADMFLSEINAFPVGASSAAFTYSFRSDLGIQSRDTRTFGPIYVERPYTVGKSRLSFGTNVGHVTFSSFEGHGLEDGIVIQQFFYQGRTRPGDEVRTTLKFSRTSVAFFSNFGVTDWLEVGAVVPMIRVGWSATLNYTEALTRRITFTTSDQMSETGIGDVSVRAKVKAIGGSKGAAGALVEYRIPTGDATKMLGALGPSVKVTALSTFKVGRMAPHINIAYSEGWGLDYIFAGVNRATQPQTSSDFFRTGAPDEVEIAAGTEYELSTAVTLVADVIAKEIRNVGSLGTHDTTFHYTDGRGDVPVSALVRRQGHSRSALGTVGVKWALREGFIASVSGLFALSDGGLEPRPSLLIGLDYSF